MRALVASSAVRLTPLIKEMLPALLLSVPGYRVRILDDNHQAASEKRLKPSRGFRGAALTTTAACIYGH